MNERYTRLFSIDKNLYASGSPVIVSAGVLLMDNMTGNVVAQLKFTNISPKAIKALRVRITPKDIAGRVCGDDIEYQYLDLNAARDYYFGSKTPVAMPDSSIRAFDVKVSNVIFVDNEVVELPDAAWDPLPRRRDLHEVLDGEEMIKQYQINLSFPRSQYIPEKIKDLWICTCGVVNRSSEQNCHSCNNNFEKELQTLADKDKLTADMNVRLDNERAEWIAHLEKEKAEREEREERQRIERERFERAEKERKEKARKKIKTLSISGGSVIAAAAIVFFLVIPIVNYNSGIGKIKDGDYAAAFEKLGNSQFLKNKGLQLIWDDIDYTAGTISADGYNMAGLKSDGTVAAVGNNQYGQCEVDDWTDITAIASGDSHTVGLKSDGTVVATEIAYDHDVGQCEVDDWTDIAAVSAGDFHTVGLKSDGTVVAVGDNEYGQCDVGDWTDIAAVSAGFLNTVGIKSDGTVVATEITDYDYDSGQSDVDGWTDIVAVSAGLLNTVGIKSDGTVVAAGTNIDVDGWTDIVAVSVGDYNALGLKSDGTVVATEITDGDYDLGQSDVDGWTDIKLPFKAK